MQEHPMRRFKQALPINEIEEILINAENGTLTCLDETGWPYAVPLNFVYTDGSILFHSAKDGKKVRALKKHPQVSFCVVGKDLVLPERYTTDYRSVIVEGRAFFVEEPAEREAAFLELCRKYRPDGTEAQHEGEIAAEGKNALIIRIQIDRMTGKARFNGEA